MKKLFAAYILVCDKNDRLELCMRWLSLKKRRFIAYDSMKAIYACDEDNGFTLYVFLTNNKKIILRQPLFEYQDWSVQNWDELIRILIERCRGFNRHNLAEAEKLIVFPILCWHSEHLVDDVKIVQEPGVFWKHSG